MVENNFKVGDKVRVIEVDYLDEDVVEVGDIFVVEKAYVSDEEPKAYIDITAHNGDDWCLYEWQVELVEEDEKDEHNDYHALESVIRELDREIAEKYEDIEELKVARDVLDMKLRDKKK